MSLLQYKSNEMFSSTELIRKSKMVFDKISKDQIEKAVILRDGKPSFMLLDFNKYEDLITEYLELKEKFKIENEENNKTRLKNTLEEIESLDLNLQKRTRVKKEDSIKDFWK